MIRRLSKIINLANSRIKYNYITPIQKPVTTLALNSMVQLSAEVLQYCYRQFGMHPEISVLIGAFGFRVGMEVLGLFFQSLNMKSKDNWVNRWIDKIFLVDLRRDISFYDLPLQRYNEMASFYKPEQLFTSFLKLYTILNFFRGSYYTINNPQFIAFCQSTIISISAHDSLFILPIAVMLVNYLILSGSKHPFFIHLVRRQNKLMCFNIAFMTGLLAVASPNIFSLSYIGIGLGHLFLRSLRNRTADWKQFLTTIKIISRKK